MSADYFNFIAQNNPLTSSTREPQYQAE